MTETPPQNDPLPDDTPPTQEQPPRRLTRSNADRVLGGVAGGLARHLDLDPSLVRIVIAVMAIGFPPTIIAYVAALFLVPSDGAPAAPGESRNRTAAAVVVGLLVLLAFPVFIPFGLIAGPPLLGFGIPLLLLAGIVWIAVRAMDDETPSGRRVAIAVGMVLIAVAGFFAAITASVFGAGWVVAAVVVLCGLALMAAAFAGGARWLLAPALLLALPLAGVAAADVRLDVGVGEREYRPASLADVRTEYELGVGELKLDLRDVEFPAGETRVRIDVGMGEAGVLVADDVCVVPDVSIGAGQARIGSRQQAGVDVQWQETAAVTGEPRLVIEAEIGAGELDVEGPVTCT